MTAAVRFLVRNDLRRRWRRFVVLALLVAVVGGVSIAAVLGADRSRTALDRFVQATNPADFAIFVQDQAQLDGIDRIAEVDTMARFTVLGLVPEQIFGRDDALVSIFAPHDTAGFEMNRYRVIEGRAPAPDAVDEIALHEATAAMLGVGVGDHLSMLGFSPGDVAQLIAHGGRIDRPSGPTVDMTVVALVRDPTDVVNRAADMVATTVSPAVYERYHDQVGSFGDGAFVTLAPGADLASFTAQVAERSPEADIERWTGATSVAETGFGTTLEVIGNGLLLIAAVVAFAGLLTLWQAFGRVQVDRLPEDANLERLGLGRRPRLVARLVPGVVVACCGALGAGAVALGLSGRFPIGVAARAEPDPGIDADPRIVLGMIVTFVLVVALVAGSAAARAGTGRIRAGAAPVPDAEPCPAGSGPVRSSSPATAEGWFPPRAAVTVGALAITAALVFSASMRHLESTPRLFGWGFDTAVSSGDVDAPTLRDGVSVGDDPAVREVGQALFQVAMEIDGSPAYGAAIGDGTGTIGPVVARGRVPRAADEVAIGRETLHQIGRSIGDDVTIDAGHGPASFHVVGQAVVPVSSDGGRVGDGVAMTTAALPRLGLDVNDGCVQESCYGQLVVRWKDGADVEAAHARLEAPGAPAFEQPVPPAEVERLTEVDAMPWIVAALLAVLAAYAVVHALTLTVLRRRRDLAVFRALGGTPRQVRWGVAVHIVVVVGWSAGIGAVSGVVAGRALWRVVGDAVGVVPAPAVPILWLVALPVAIVAIAELAAVVPAWAASRARASLELRSE